MKFLIISHVLHSQKNSQVFGYGPYVKEMNLWLKYVDEVRIVAPMREGEPDPIDLPYEHDNLRFNRVASFNLLSLGEKIKTVLNLPYIFIQILLGMYWADHIHLRCPGNMGLLGAVAQLFFPSKVKTVKYAGNWDPDSLQPRSYRIQQTITSNPKLSKNINVLVYGKWPDQSENIVEFFTASYHENEKEEVEPRDLGQEIRLVFVGALSPGKRPIISVKAVHELIKSGNKVRLDLMGEGPQREELENYISEHKLHEHITLHGNQNSHFVKEKFKEAHFLILMSKSEGWPKVVAEAMFWGAVPITTNVSCVNYMIGEGSRGSLVNADEVSVAKAVSEYLENPESYKKTSQDAMQWSRQFTLESFSKAIKQQLEKKGK